MASCRNAVAGIMGEAILINFDDWKGATITKSSSVISAISMGTGVYGYKFTSHERAFEASVQLQKGTYNSAFAHQLIMRAFDRTQNLKNDINKIANGRYVAIVVNRDSANPETVYEVYGEENGLVATAIEFNSTDGDGVAYAITLASEDNARESEVPTSIFTNTLDATKTMVDALVAAES